MKPLFKSFGFKSLLSILIILLVVKILWLMIEMFWLSSGGVEYEKAVSNKSLYYRVKLSPNEAKVPVKKVIKPIAGSIKDIKLIAVYNASDSTVVTIEYKRKTKILGRGDMLNGFMLQGGGSTYANFTKDGKLYRVDLIKSKKSTVNSSIKLSSQPKRVRPAAKKVGGEITDAGDHKIIDKSLLDHYAKNMDDIYKNIGITEIKKSGKTTGFKVTFVKRGSPFAKLGLRRGDILKEINGEELNSLAAAFSAYKNVTNVTNLTLVIIRGKKEMELEYEIN